jgi:predicted membrane protein
MSLLSVLIALVIAGVVLWFINTYIPMDRKIKTILNVVVVIIVILWLLSVFGIFGSLSNIHIGDTHMHMRR